MAVALKNMMSSTDSSLSLTRQRPVLIRKLLNENERFQLEYLIDQFKPIRSRIHLIQLKETGILDSNIYLDMNAQISDEVFATLDDYQDINGTIVLK